MAELPPTRHPAPPTRLARLGRNLTVRVLVAIALGVAVGVVWPAVGRAMKPVGDTFVNLVRMVIAPVIFLTIVLGVAHAGDLKRVGRVGLKALVYFEVVTTLALAIGLVVVNLVRPGEGIDARHLSAADVSRYTTQGQELRFVDFVTHIVPSSVVGAFAQGEILQVVFFSILFGVALASLGEAGRAVTRLLDGLMQVFFRIVAIIMVVAPLGAFGAHGVHHRHLRRRLADLVGPPDGLCVRHDGGLHLRGARAHRAAVGLQPDPPAGPHQGRDRDRARDLVERGGAAQDARPDGALRLRPVGGRPGDPRGVLVQSGRHLDLPCRWPPCSSPRHTASTWRSGSSWRLLAVLMVTSKGAAGVTGSGFIVLASTLSALRVVPVEGVALVLGVDRFMSEARAITNLIGNAVATVVIARSEGAFEPRLDPPSVS